MRAWQTGNRITVTAALTVLALTGGLAAPPARGDAFSSYKLAGAFDLPANTPFDVLADGRLVALSGADVYAETALGTRVFDRLGRLPNMDVPGYAAAFLRVSPDGTHIAVGNNGGASYTNYKVGVFTLSGLQGDWFPAAHYEAEWFDGTRLALSAGAWGQPSRVTVLDVTSNPANPVNTTVIDGIGGATAGVTFDAAGRLYTGNGAAGGGPSGTGWIKAFTASAWQAALSGGAAVDFEASGTLVADVLSAGALGWDLEGNLHVGGGEYVLRGDRDYAGLVRASAVANALAGGGPAQPGDIRRLDPDNTTTNFYDVNYNPVTQELYVRDMARVWVYAVPEPGGLLVLMAVVACFGRRISLRGGRGDA